MSMRTLASGIAVALSVASFAQASAISHVALTEGASAANFAVDGIDVAASTDVRNFKWKQVAGFWGAGVEGGAVNGEIDGSESILFEFDAPVLVTSLSLGALYTAGNYGDIVNEGARIETNLGVFELYATGATTASWNGLGVVGNDSPGVQDSGGAWTIAGDDLFGGAVTWLRLSSANPGAACMGDFTFRGLSVATVPAPGAFAMLVGAGLVGHRRRRAA